MESYLECQYTTVLSLLSAQLITEPVYTVFKSRSKAIITTKRIRSFAIAFECRRNSRRIINTRLLHLNEFGVRKHKYHSLVPSHGKRIVVDSLRNLNLTLTLTAEQNI